MLSTRNSINADQAVPLVHQLIAKLPYESLIKPLDWVSTHSNTNAFPIRWLSEESSRLPEGPWVKRQEDGWLDAVREPTLKISILAFFYWFSIKGWSLLTDFVIGLLVSIDWKGENYDSILVIVDQLTKMVHYELVKITFNAPALSEVIINVIVRHHGLPDLIVTNKGFLFTSKFWLLLCYFFGIKRRLSTTFHP